MSDRSVRIVFSNLNPGWGGGELWFLNAAREMSARGHDVRTVVSAESRLACRLTEIGQEVCPESTDPFAAGAADVVICNNRKKDVKHVLRFDSRPRRGLILRRGVPRRIRNHFWGRGEIYALSRIITNSDATSKVVRESLPWFPEERLTRIYNPVEFEPLPHVPGDGTLRIVAVSRLVEHKGVEVLLAAVKRLRRPWSLTIAGDGRYRESLESMAGEGVTFLGHVEDIRPVYANADVMVIPSRYEGFCFSAVEGALSGLPIISNRVGSLPEVVPHATFTEPDDPEGLAEILESFVPERHDPGATRRRFEPLRIFSKLETTLHAAADEEPVGQLVKRSWF